MIYLAKRSQARYSDLKSERYLVGDRSLSRLLKELQNNGLVTRKVLATFPVATSYSLTEKGRYIAERLIEIEKAIMS